MVVVLPHRTAAICPIPSVPIEGMAANGSTDLAAICPPHERGVVVLGVVVGVLVVVDSVVVVIWPPSPGSRMVVVLEELDDELDGVVIVLDDITVVVLGVVVGVVVDVGVVVLSVVVLGVVLPPSPPPWITVVDDGPPPPGCEVRLLMGYPGQPLKTRRPMSRWAPAVLKMLGSIIFVSHFRASRSIRWSSRSAMPTRS